MSNMGLASGFVTDAALSFKMTCFRLLDDAYSEVYKLGVVTREWDENAVTELLVGKMNKNPDGLRMHITAVTEQRLLPEDALNPPHSVDGAYRIDIKIGGFGWIENETRKEYYMEAKNLYCHNFKKNGNATMTDSTQYARRYVSTGIGNLLDGHYPPDTLLLGYVLEGTVKEAVELLNLLLTKSSRNVELIGLSRHPELPHLKYGQSNHPNNGMRIEHCFLLF